MNVQKWPKISIIILNWNGVLDTIDCLESLKNIKYKNYEIIVVDNGSKGNDVEVLKQKYGNDIHIIKNDMNYGYAEGNNIGMRYALGRGTAYFLLLNNDIVVEKNILEELVQVAERDRKIAFVGIKIYDYNETDKINFAGGKIDFYKGLTPHIGLNEKDHGQYDEIKDVDYVMSPLIRTEVIEKIGLLDPTYFLYMEEVDWAVRAKRCGYRIVFAPRAKIWHKIGLATNDLTKLFYMLRNILVFEKKYAKKRELIVFFWFYLFFQVPVMSFRLFLKYPKKTSKVILKAMALFKRP